MSALAAFASERRSLLRPRHVGVGLATTSFAAGSVLAFGASLRALAAGVFCCALVVVTATDIDRRIVPNLVVGPASVLVLGLMTAARPSPEWVIAGVSAAGFLLLAALVYPGGMGMGDVKLAFLMGSALGGRVTVALAIGMLAAIVPAIVLLARHGLRARKMAMPYAPFLALGSAVALFAGGPLIDWYLTTL